MTKLFGRVPVLALLLCAGCGNSTATTGAGGEGGATAASNAASGTGGSTPGTMACQLAIANIDANIAKYQGG